MYRFIFYFIYRSQVNQKDGGPSVARIISSMIVFVAISFHILFIYSIARFLLFNFFATDISFASRKTYSGKLFFWIPIFVLALLPILKYFNTNRINKILAHYNQIEDFYSIFNIIKFITIFILPLIIAIILVNHSIS